jgi:hypothetical protein
MLEEEVRELILLLVYLLDQVEQVVVEQVEQAQV